MSVRSAWIDEVAERRMLLADARRRAAGAV